MFAFPNWIEQLVVVLILIGFPVALVLAWAFDATPQGIVRAGALADEAATSPAMKGRSRRTGIAVGTLGVLVALIAGSAYWHFGHRGSAAIRAGRDISPALASSSVEEFATKGDSVTPQLLWHPVFDPIRNDPRFRPY